MRTLTLGALLFLFAYPFLIFPVILRVWARRRPAPPEPAGDGEGPSVALLICALNEQGIIREKLQNSLELRYPAGKLTIVVVSDGSTDRTADIVREFASKRVVLIEQSRRRGKIANLNEIIPARSEEIVVLSDANVLYHRDAVWNLVARFREESIGCVSGKVILTDTTQELDAPTQSYYSMEWTIQQDSSAIYSMVGADGAMYALRRDFFRPCPGDTLIEDLVIPMQVIAQGKRVVLEPQALGWEKGVETVREEFRRKVRIAAGAAQTLARGNGWPKNAPARFHFIFISHKVLRWLSPVSGLLLVLAAAAWRDDRLAQVVLAGGTATAGLALVRLFTGWKHILVSAPFYFLFGQVAIAAGFLKGLAGQQTVLWAKADR